jgi:hypothetical protein
MIRAIAHRKPAAQAFDTLGKAAQAEMPGA